MTQPTKRVVVFAVAVLVASGGAAAFVGGSGVLQQDDPDPASFEVSELTAPNTTEPTEDLTVTATVSNPSDVTDTQVVKYRFEGTVLAQEFVTLGPGESTTVEFTADLSGVGSGEYVHGVFTRDTGAVATIGVPTSFEVTELNAPTSAPVGEELTVNATVTNPGDVASTQEVEFRLNGEVLDRQTVELGAGESTNVTFEVDTNGIAPGEYFHGILTRDFGEFAGVTFEPREADADSTVTFADQSSDGTTVVIEEVTVSEGGFVAIHDETLLDGEVTGSVIGVSEYLEPGTYEEVTVQLFDVPGATFEDATLNDTSTLIAMPHFDTGANERYDFVRTNGQVDGPYVQEGEVVIDDAAVTVGDETDNETDTPDNVTETPDNVTETPDNVTETPDNVTDTPDNVTDTPDNVTETPDNVTETPDNVTETPGNATEAPGNATDAPEGETDTPATTPGEETDTPGEGSIPPLTAAFLGVASMLAIPAVRS